MIKIKGSLADDIIQYRMERYSSDFNESYYPYSIFHGNNMIIWYWYYLLNVVIQSLLSIKIYKKRLILIIPRLKEFIAQI